MLPVVEGCRAGGQGGGSQRPAKGCTHTISLKPHWWEPSPVLGGYSTGLGSFLPLLFYVWGLAAGFHLVFFQLFLFCL